MRSVRCPSNLIGWRLKLIGTDRRDAHISNDNRNDTKGSNEWWIGEEGIVMKCRRVKLMNINDDNGINGSSINGKSSTNSDIVNDGNDSSNVYIDARSVDVRSTTTTTSIINDGDNNEDNDDYNDNNNNRDGDDDDDDDKYTDELYIRIKHQHVWINMWSGKYELLSKVMNHDVMKITTDQRITNDKRSSSSSSSSSSSKKKRGKSDRSSANDVSDNRVDDDDDDKIVDCNDGDDDRDDDDRFQCGWMSYQDISHHLCYSCSNREVLLDQRYVGSKNINNELLSSSSTVVNTNNANYNYCSDNKLSAIGGVGDDDNVLGVNNKMITNNNDYTTTSNTVNHNNNNDNNNNNSGTMIVHNVLSQRTTYNVAVEIAEVRSNVLKFQTDYAAPIYCEYCCMEMPYDVSRMDYEVR